MKLQTIEALDNKVDQLLLYRLVSESNIEMMNSGALSIEYMQQIENDQVPPHLKGKYLEALSEFVISTLPVLAE